MNGVNRPVATRVLDHYPEIRTTVAGSPEFGAWISSLSQIEVDGETLYVRGGDMLRDRDQIILEWARRNNLLTGEAVARALKETDE